MRHPRLQLLTDYKSFCNLFDIGQRGAWRYFDADVIHHITHILKDIEHDVVVYDYVKEDDFSGIEDHLKRQSALFFTSRTLEFFDRFSFGEVGRMVEMNNLDYKTNSIKSERLKRICFNIEDPNQITDFLGFVNARVSGSIVFEKGSTNKKDSILDWSFKEINVIDSIVLGNSYIDVLESKKISTLDNTELEDELKKGIHSYLRSVFPNDEFKKKYRFFYLTKVRKHIVGEQKPNNIIEALYHERAYSEDRIEDIIREALEDLCSDVKLIWCDNWHHRKIFSDYFRIVHDDSLGLKRSTTYSIEGILHHYRAYWEGVEELKRHSGERLKSFYGVKSLKELLGNRNS
jgi:hypothetical protein